MIILTMMAAASITAMGSGYHIDVPLPRYSETPNPSEEGKTRCRDAYNGLQTFEAQFEGFVWNHEIDNGGRLSFNQANDIRNASHQIQERYADAIRHIGWEGRGAECEALAQQGHEEITERVIRPVFQ